MRKPLPRKSEGECPAARARFNARTSSSSSRTVVETNRAIHSPYDSTSAKTGPAHTRRIMPQPYRKCPAGNPELRLCRIPPDTSDKDLALIGRAVKIEGERQRVLESLHGFGGKSANSAFKTYRWQRSQSLNVGYRFTIQKREPRQEYFVRTVSPLRGERPVQDERPRGSGSWRETMTMGRVLAASPRSASKISPGWGFIEQVQDILFSGARARDIQGVVIGEFCHLGDA